MVLYYLTPRGVKSGEAQDAGSFQGLEFDGNGSYYLVSSFPFAQ